MIYGMYLSTMGALSQTQRHATISNNLANANTHGFKPDWSLFKEVPVENKFHPDRYAYWDKVLMNTGGGVWNDTTITNLAAGPMQHTGNPFDLALEDEPGSDKTSFFMIRPANAADGEVYYTRDGHFIPDSNNILRTVTGDAVLGVDGQPVTVAAAPANSNLAVREDGSVIATTADANTLLGQIAIRRTADYREMVKVGDSRFRANGAQMEAWQNGVKPGYLEESSTNAIEEMTNMIEASRIYETNMRFLTIQDEQLGNAVRRIAARTGA